MSTRRPEVDRDPNALRQTVVVLRRRERTWLGRIAVASSIIALLVVTIYGLTTWRYLQRVNPPGDPGAAQTFEVVEGDDLNSLSRRLEASGFVVDDSTFRRYVDGEGGLEIVPGFYTLRPRDHMGNLLRALRTPPEETFWKVTIPEGYTISQMADRLTETVPGFDGAAFVSRAFDPDAPIIESRYAPGVTNLEGLLFPDTYSIAGDETPSQILQRMVRLMERVGRQEGLDDAGSTVGLDPYQILTIASMIEREAKTEKDRPIIARVIYNRLAMGMKLEIDATLYYGQDPETPFDVLKTLDTPYNTYLVGGLPPTPIASPGRASIAAALAPAPNPLPSDPLCADLPTGAPCAYLYYVLSDRDGNHTFAVTLDQHEANVATAIAEGVL